MRKPKKKNNPFKPQEITPAEAGRRHGDTDPFKHQHLRSEIYIGFKMPGSSEEAQIAEQRQSSWEDKTPFKG